MFTLQDFIYRTQNLGTHFDSECPRIDGVAAGRTAKKKYINSQFISY